MIPRAHADSLATRSRVHEHVPAALRPVLFVVLALFVHFVLYFPKQLFVAFVARKSCFPFSGLLDLARDEFGKIVEGFLNLGGRNVFVQRGLKTFIRQGFGCRFVALGGKRLHLLDFPGNPGLDEFESACTHV